MNEWRGRRFNKYINTKGKFLDLKVVGWFGWSWNLFESFKNITVL
jgi:hypothetical protein